MNKFKEMSKKVFVKDVRYFSSDVKENVKIYSPELFVYQSQVTSLYSVFNRVASVMLLLFWLSAFLFIKVFKFAIFSYIFYLLNFYILFSFNLVLNIIIIFILNIFLFHLFVGIRHFIWDTGQILELSDVNYSNIFIIVLLLTVQILVFIEA